VQLHEVQCWFQSSTDKGKLAAALQTRLEQVGAGFLSSDKDTLRRLVSPGLCKCSSESRPSCKKVLSQTLARLAQQPKPQ
jgi:hypothetical protein